MRIAKMLHVMLALALAGQPADDWQAQESAHLQNIRQITRDFVRAGEGYFAPDGQSIIFQAEQQGDNPFYQMFVMNLQTGATRRVSPGVGKTTCGYFHPDGKRLLFASSHLDPDAKKHYAAERALRDEEKQSKKRRRYVWDFDAHMDIFEANVDGSGSLKRLTDAPGYDAEGSYSADGKHIVFCSNRTGPKNLELFIMDADGANVRQLTKAPGCYNGGPFFSPDGTKVIFRSDRKKKDHLQLYVINVDGTGEQALTDDDTWVFWAPYWYKDSKHIIYTAADHSNPMARPNYDLYWMNIETGKKARLTFAPGADVLPVFSPDYRRLLWTSTRDGRQPAQLFLADVTLPRE
jgi:TolB protein